MVLRDDDAGFQAIITQLNGTAGEAVRAGRLIAAWKRLWSRIMGAYSSHRSQGPGAAAPSKLRRITA